MSRPQIKQKVSASATSKTAAMSEDFVNIFKENGLEKMAAEVGMVKDGVIPAVQNYSREKAAASAASASSVESASVLFGSQDITVIPIVI